ncbi:MAG: hypothetical protein RIA71_07815 [Oceanicaulis sp.]
MSLFVRTAVAVVLAPAAAVGALWGADLLLGGEGAGEAAPAPEVQPSRYDLFSPRPGDDRAAAVNAACGFAPSLTGGGTRIVMWGDPLDQIHIDRARDGAEGADGTFTRFAADPRAVHAFARNGELYVQAGHEDRDGLEGRVWMLDASGEPTFSGPQMPRGRMALTCDDAQGAAEAFNAALAPVGGPAEPVRAGVRAFQVGGGYDEPPLVSGDAFVSACTPEAVLADLTADAPFVLTADYDAEARYGDGIINDMSGESLEGVAEPMVHVTIADLTAAPDYADLLSYSLPLSWSDLAPGEGAVAVIYRFEAVGAHQFMIAPNGARPHSMGAGVYADVSLPCADPQAGIAALRDLRDRALDEAMDAQGPG